MSERYWITGVQLGLLIALPENLRKETVEGILDKQFIGDKEQMERLLGIEGE